MARPEDWKQKYLDNLEQLERSEKQWERTETLLRNTVSRLCLAAEGVDGALDQQLDTLRGLARKRNNDEQIAGVLASINRILLRLDNQRKERPLTPVDVMAELLRRVDWPRGMGKSVKIMRRQLDRADDKTPVRPLMAEFGKLLEQAMGGQTDDGETRGSRRDGGLLGRLFGKPDEVEKIPASADSAPDPALLAAAVLMQVFTSSRLPARWQAEFDDLRERVNRAKTEKELHRLARQLGKLISEVGSAEDGDAPQTSTVAQMRDADVAVDHADDDPTPSGPGPGEVMLQLLERMDLGEGIDEIKVRLEHGVEVQEWPQILKTIADRIHAMREEVQQEKRALEQFLVQLTDRLDEIDGSISGMEKSRIEAHEDGVALTRSVNGEVSSMRDSIRETSSLDDIKHMIQERLGHISAHMDEFRQREEQRNQEAQQRIEQLNDKLRELDSESAALRERMQKTRDAAMRDRLTGLYNRSAYEEKLAEEYARWKRYLEPLTLAVFDIDHFKRINDSYGHLAGDKALRTIAQLLQKNTRETDIIARYGGEEFVMLMPGTRGPEALVVAEKLRDAVEHCGFHYKNKSVVVTISCGLSEFLGDDTPDEVFARADKALYQCKEAGRNQCKLIN